VANGFDPTPFQASLKNVLIVGSEEAERSATQLCLDSGVGSLVFLAASFQALKNISVSSLRPLVIGHNSSFLTLYIWRFYRHKTPERTLRC